MNTWLIIYRVSCAALAVMVIIAIVGIFLPQIRETEARRQRITILEEEKRAKTGMTLELRNKLERFNTDPAYVERVAREKLGKARPGEVIFRVVEPETNAVSP